jgi:prepilin-type N-terminal cleavage/methylation domain-containing protein
MKGFTLVEILISTIILTILILAAFQIMEVDRSSWFSADVSVQLRQEIIKAYMKMERELRQTRPAQINLGSGSSASSITFRIPQDNNGDGTILDGAGNIEWSGNITYALNGSNQIIRTASGVTTIIANNVINLRFTRPISPVNILEIDTVVQRTSATGKPMQDTGQLILKMRN